MSIKIMTTVWDKADANGSELLMLLALADMANDTGICWPSIDHLAKKVRLDRRQAIRLLDKLESKGYISKKRRSNQTTIYRVNVGDIQDTCHTRHPGSDIQDTPEVTSMSPLEVSPVSPKSSIEPSNKHNRTVIVDDSQAFDANPLSSAFVKASGIMPYSLDRWLKSVEELAKMGAAPDDVTKAVANLPSRYKIAGPWSIQNAVAIVMAERSKKERAEDKRPPEVGNTAPVFTETKSAARQKSQFEKEYGL